MKWGEEHCDRSLTVSYGIGRQLDQLIRYNFVSGAWVSFKGREAPSSSLSGSAEGMRVLMHSCLMGGLGLHCKPKFRDHSDSTIRHTPCFCLTNPIALVGDDLRFRLPGS